MAESLLDECHESILKIAATQPPDGKKAILIMAEMIRSNFGLASFGNQALSSQNFHASDRHRLPSRRRRQ
jgi:hypothetical protein